ncbi:MBL fold metallo-hydrolase [Moritella yayanosii]|uniref:Zn-dependent hydrolase n=1 Tax=Moritella yayanosii TaxID=69539 RepID=A0A330LML9_9GAMM|nr:MBL fold metallo-hydrolase [Moritella yayanosii]SQD78100.1 Zn-dependent hydrolase [Moritella yayanosii]
MQIHHIEGYIQTILLVEYPDKLLLLDGGCRCDVPVITAFITETLQREMSDLKLILVSHMHPDHAGGAHLLRKKFSCKIASVGFEQQWYQGFKGRIGHAIDLMLALYVARRKGKKFKNIYYHPHLHPDIILHDETCVPDFSEWMVHFTPGHTDRDLSFLHQPTQQMYVGDMILKLKNRFTSPFPIYQPKAYKQSLNKLLQLNITKILMAHDGYTEISREDIQRLITKSPNRPLTVEKVIKHKFKSFIFNNKA